jgi:hypothetical protein
MTPPLEVLHVPDCPNLAVMLARLRHISNQPVITREIATVADAAAAGMSGSPTLLVNGVDPFRAPNQLAGAIACRVYRDEHGHRGPAPSLLQLRDALTAVPADPTAGATRPPRSSR